MNENGMTTETVETGGIIDDMGVDVSEFVQDDGADQTEETTHEADTPAESGEGDSPTEDTTGGDNEAQEATENPTDGNADSFTLKYMGEERTVSRQEAISLAQQGLDYARIRGQLDEARKELEPLRKFREENSENLEFLSQVASSSGMSLSDFIDEVRVSQISRQQNISKEVARERVAREKAEKKLSQQSEQAAAKNQQQNEDERRRKEISEFVQRFPGVGGKDIPADVWAKVRGGETLVNAYISHLVGEKDKEIADLQRQLAAKNQNEKNKRASVGTQRAVGSESARDKFLDIFLSDD